jgi:hypothetical protein
MGKIIILRRLIPIFVLVLASSTYALPSPTITSAILNNGTIEIQGENFGNTNPMLFWDDADTVFNQSNARSGDVVATGLLKPWGQNTNIYGSPMEYRKSDSTRNKQGSITYFGTGHKNFLGSPHYTGALLSINKLYVSWWYKPLAHPNSEGGSNKFIRIWDDANGYGTRISWTQMHLTCNGDTSSWGAWIGTANKWHHHEFYVDLDKKVIVAKVNGKIIHNVSNCAKETNEYAQNKPLYIELIGFDHGSSNYQTMTTELDDIYVANSRGRVVLTNEPTWSDSAENEVLPITSWSNEKILAETIKGVIKIANKIYIYTVDAEGNVNQNGAELICMDCPKME